MVAEIEIIHGDSLLFDPKEHARFFQGMITDPPYSKHVHENITSAGTMGGDSRGWHRQDLGFAHADDRLMAHLAEWAARCPGWSLIYSDHESSHLWRAHAEHALAKYIRALLVGEDAPEGEEAPEVYVDAFPWERWSQPQKSGDRPTQGFEVVSLFWGVGSSRKIWNGPGNATALHHKSLRGADKHRTEKPLDQLLDLVSWFTNGPGLPWGEHPAIVNWVGPVLETIPAAQVSGRVMTDTPVQRWRSPVLDPCVGSGTTAVACALLDRSCVGFELDEAWAVRAEKRALGALKGELSDRDRERAERWVMATMAEAEGIAYPKAKDGSDVRTWERAQRRLHDARRVAEKLL